MNTYLAGRLRMVQSIYKQTVLIFESKTRTAVFVWNKCLVMFRPRLRVSQRQYFCPCGLYGS